MKIKYEIKQIGDIWFLNIVLNPYKLINLYQSKNLDDILTCLKAYQFKQKIGMKTVMHITLEY